ncbi:MAG: efflux RND transporter permease subunit [Gemmataceae bacterium]
MIHKLIDWALHNALVVVLGVLVLAGLGGYAFLHVNVEAYPDPAPPIIEVIAQYPGASAEEVERLVTIPMEVMLAGMPGLQYTRSKSLAGLAHLRNQFEYGIDYNAARQEVINRLQFTTGLLPNGITPSISPTTPTGELMRYTVRSPKDAAGRDLYLLRDLKAVQDWSLVREFSRLPRIAGVASFGGEVKRYEIHPDPEQLQRYGITLQQLQNAVSNSNANVGAGFLNQGGTAVNVRGVGLLGQGADPLQRVLSLAVPQAAFRLLRDDERQRVEDIREIVVASVNNVPVRVRDLCVHDGNDGVTVGYQPRLGRVGLSRPRLDDAGRPVHTADGAPAWVDEDDKVQGLVLMRKGEATLAALEAVQGKVTELNETPGRLPPGMQLVPHFDLTGLLHRTTETVHENLFLGMVLVVLILLMFLSNVRSALIVAVNIPLALLFAFSVLFLRGKSANLLSIGAVDFGIIVDSTVIIVENIYRHLSSSEGKDLELKQRILRACGEVEKPLFYSTAIMVCALLPLLTMRGVEGQIFGPMADTYAFALGGALLLALIVSPVLCLIFLRNLKPKRENVVVRGLQAVYVWQLRMFLKHRPLALGGLGLMVLVTALALPYLGREFMPELEEGNLYVRGTFPVNIALDEAAARARTARAMIRGYSEVALVASQVGRPDDGTDPTGFYNVEFSVPLRPEEEWPKVVEQTGWRAWLFGPKRARTKAELVHEMNAELDRYLIGVDWNFSQYIRDNVMESLSGVKGDNSVKIVGPDLDELERVADRVKATLDTVPGVHNAGVFRIKGQPTLEFTVDRQKCKFWNVSVADVENAVKVAVGGQAVTQMIEGEKTFDVTLRWPAALRGSEAAILDIPVDVTGNQVTPGYIAGLPATPVSGAAASVSTIGTTSPMPALLGSIHAGTLNNAAASPRLRLRHLVTPVNDRGEPDPAGTYLRTRASTIYREQGKRLIAVKFSVRDRDLASTVADAQRRVEPLLQVPYRAEWSGEFQQMEQAERRLVAVVGVALGLIVCLIYLAFRSFLDTLVVLSGAVAVALGGIWALLLTGLNFNISAAVGFISILGVAIMNGLILVSSFNANRAHGLPVEQALIDGVRKLARPVVMTALAAILGLLPAAISTKIGSQSQRPLAIAVVGGMLATLLLTNLVPLLYSFYGHREPPEGAGSLAH